MTIPTNFRFWIFDFRLSEKKFRTRNKNFSFMVFSCFFSLIQNPKSKIQKLVKSLDDLGALLVQKLMAAIGAEKFDLLVPELLVVTIELAFALRAGHPKNFRHASVPRIFSRKDAKALSLGIKPISKKIFDLTFASLRLCGSHLSFLDLRHLI